MPYNLTENQINILKLKSEGCTLEEIAFKKCVSRHTVKNTITLILNNMGCDNMHIACIKAFKEGIIK